MTAATVNEPSPRVTAMNSATRDQDARFEQDCHRDQSSRGIGAAVVERLAQGGFSVAIDYSGNAAPAEALMSKIKAGGGQAMTAQADVSDPAAMLAMFDKAAPTFGGVDVLVNNAATMTLSPIAETDDASFDKQVAINFKGVFNGLRLAAKHLRDGLTATAASTGRTGQCQPERAEATSQQVQ